MQHQLLPVVCGISLITIAAADAFAQADRVPTGLQLTLASREGTQGSAVSALVRLRNLRDEPVAARERTDVAIESSLLRQPVRVTIRVGQDSASTSLIFDEPGVAQLRATAPNLPTAYAVIAIRPRGRAATLIDTLRRPFAAVTEQLYPHVHAAQQPSPPRLWIEVLPPRMTAKKKAWAGRVVIGVVDDRHQPIAADHDFQVQLAAKIGTIEPDHLRIPQGAATVAEDVRITSDQPGIDTIYAWSPVVGGTVAREVEYERARPSKLSVSFTPAEVVTNGRTSVQVAVLLKDDDNHVVPNPGRDLRVLLESTLGTLSQNVVTVAPGRADSEPVVLSSRRAGNAVITADADGLERDKETVRFTLPWLLMTLAAAGGTAGAMVRSRRGRRRGHLAGDTGIGAVLGIVFFALALFGVSGLLPAVPLDVVENLTLNEIGALLLGFLGGYIGRRYLNAVIAPRHSGEPVAAA